MNRTVQLALVALRMPGEYLAMLRAGMLNKADSWYMAKGAAKYVEAIASGDVAEEETIAERRRICKACSSRITMRIRGADAESDWCGPAGVDALNIADKPTCGCLLAAKTAVGSERCPQSKW